MRPLIVANWKMNPATREEARRLAALIRQGLSAVRGVEVVLAPPFPFLADVKLSCRGLIRLGAQDAFWETKGPYTGEVSPPMLKRLGVSHVILGHSERRGLLGETDEMVNRKVRSALSSGLRPIIAVGETERETREVVPPTIATELARSLAGIPRRSLERAIIAYEPVWAISTSRAGRPGTPDHATRRAIYIRKLLVKLLGGRVANTVRILYGGSVTAKNAAHYLSRDIRGMEGLLVGSASLNPGEFTKIVSSLGRGA